MRIIISAALFFSSIAIWGKSDIDFIDPMIGTDELGHTTPAATTPFGMVQLGPSMDISPWNWKRCSGYHYDDGYIMGFAHNHISGAGLGALGDILFMPMTGDLKTMPGTPDSPDNGYISSFRHEEEKASAGYYSVCLEDYGIQAELTASTRAGFHRYTPESSGVMHIVIDPIHGISEGNFSGHIEFMSDRIVRGWKQSSGMAGNRKVYFYAMFSKPFDSFGTANGTAVNEGSEMGSGTDIKGYVSFELDKKESIEISVAISHTGYDGAFANFMAEAEGMTFDAAHKRARDMWQEKCGKFRVTGTDREKRIFYTAVYHSFISPNIISDVTGDYYIYGQVRHSDIDQYSNWSTWDTYRATHPLFTIVDQHMTAAFVNSLSSRKTELGSYLPVWECHGNDCICMIGRSPAAIMAEAILKDIDGIDRDAAYSAMRESLLATDRSDWWYGSEKSGLDIYKNNGYITSAVRTSVAKTLEFNYYDYAIAKVAEKLGKPDDMAFFRKRSLGYRYLWNPEKRLMWPRSGDGDFVELDLTSWNSLNAHYVSGNIWGYSTYTPHDMDYMINLLGGPDGYVEWLDSIFSDNTEMTGHQILDISGFIGKYGHGDEPSHQMPYLYALAGAPEKTQSMVHRISREMYGDTPDGLVNNDDLGQMSSWYIFSSLGFYPVNPASCTYVLGRPLYRKAVVELENGNTLEIKAENWKAGSYMVDKVLLNGKELKDWTVSHSDLMKGGRLVFVMK